MTWSFPTHAEGAFAGTSFFPLRLLTGYKVGPNYFWTEGSVAIHQQGLSRRADSLSSACRSCVGRVCEGEVDMSDVSCSL